MVDPITSHEARSARHATHYLACGPEDGPLVVFVHGWPELSISWRHQLPVFGALGFRAVAPDLRGYGRSTVHPRREDYAQREVVGDMLELLDSLGRERAVWVGHDWGAPTVWNLARLHPGRCVAVAALCVPYFTIEQGLGQLVSLVDRALYPADTFPAGQWDYMLFYAEQFERATRVFDADPYRTMKALLRKPRPDAAERPARMAKTRAMGGWFGPAEVAPDLPRDDDVVSEEDLQAYAEALRRNGFFGPDAYYVNDEANRRLVAQAPERLALPVLFLHARRDAVCRTIGSRLAEPMRERCDDLCEVVIDSGHWMAQERPREVSAALLRWLATRVPAAWPAGATG